MLDQLSTYGKVDEANLISFLNRTPIFGPYSVVQLRDNCFTLVGE
jgi:hypothetical protein